MSKFYTGKEFLTLFIPSVILAVLVLCGSFVWEKQYQEKKLRVGDSYEIVVEKLNESPVQIFNKGEDDKMKRLLIERGYILRDEVKGVYGGTFLETEDYGKVLYRENGKTVRQDPPLIEDKVYLFGDYGFTIIYINNQNEVTHLFTAAS